MLEEQQIQDYVHKMVLDERVRQAVLGEAAGVSVFQDVSPRVAQILARLAPSLDFEQRSAGTSAKWWHA